MARGTLRAAACAVALTLAMTTAAQAAPDTTLSRTIVPGENGRLKPGPGDDRLVRDDLAAPKDGRAATRSPLLFFVQMSDSHVIDEESPLRVEFTDKLGSIFTSAYRPQEGMGAQVLSETVENLRNAESPIAPGRRLDLVIQTGDNTDSGQCNETLWMIDVMSGGRAVTPDSGKPSAGAYACAGATRPAPPTSCPASESPRYEGVRKGDYYEPDGAGDGKGYEKLRDYPGLFTDMNRCFVARGFGETPWYAVFGNHDGLIQGNQPRNPGFEALGVGPLKPDDSAGGAKLIEPDPRRKPLSKNRYIKEHLLDGGHGFKPENEVSGMGNYAFSPAQAGGKVRFVVLDTISEHGLENGNLDDDQFRWIHEELTKADDSGQLAILFGHHSLKTLGQPPASPFAPGDTGGNLSPVVHFGLGPRETGIDMPCPTTDPKAATTPPETLKCLMLRHPSAVAFVNGHEHNNRIDPFAGGEHGFWEVNTASHIDFPQQARLIDVADNCDGTVSIFGTLVDHAGPANPGVAASPRDARTLASISRELSHFEPQGSRGAGGDEDDKNVELLVKTPSTYAGTC